MTGMKKAPLTMAGTEGTNKYLVLARSSFGQVGYRDLGDLGVRIRVEPSAAKVRKIARTLTREAGWKQPGDGGQDRFSIVLPKGRRAEGILKEAFGLIKRGRPLIYDQPMPTWSASAG